MEQYDFFEPLSNEVEFSTSTKNLDPVDQFLLKKISAKRKFLHELPKPRSFVFTLMDMELRLEYTVKNPLNLDTLKLMKEIDKIVDKKHYYELVFD